MACSNLPFRHDENDVAHDGLVACVPLRRACKRHYHYRVRRDMAVSVVELFFGKCTCMVAPFGVVFNATFRRSRSGFALVVVFGGRAVASIGNVMGIFPFAVCEEK